MVPGKTTDITLEKLDNTQWLLRYLSPVDGVTPPVIPGSTYTVYTDFMDSAPYSLIYARKAPTLTMQYKNLNAEQAYINITDEQAQPWRDIQFYTIWDSPNRTQVKYYQYFLYDNTGTEIGRSEELYDSDLTWFFRGFQTSDNEINPVYYSVEVRIVDEYDAEFTAQSQFTIYYTSEQGIVPLNVTLDCEEKALRVEVTAPVYVESTERGGKQSAEQEDISLSGGYITIPDDKVLNYTRVLNATQDPIIISPTFSFLTQFQLTDEFIDSIPWGGEVTITEVAHKISPTVFDTFTLKLSSFKRYYITDDGVIQVNQNQFKMKWYKNGSAAPLKCFNNQSQDYYDLSDTITELLAPGEFSYALRPEGEFLIVDRFPDDPVEGQKYVLTQDVVFRQNLYYQGVYVWQGTSWQPNTEDEFLFVENLSQIPGFDYDSLQVPENARSTAGDNDLLWTEEGNVWVDTGEYVDRVNKNIITSRWILLYLVVDNTNSTAETSDQESVKCDIQINSERV